jgi:poly(3-hydroxybutyrate) depolymerase
VGGQVDTQSPVVTVQPTQPVPIIMLHGKDDSHVRYEGGLSGNEQYDRVDISFQESVLLWAENNLCLLDEVETEITEGLRGQVRIDTLHDCDKEMYVRAISIDNFAHDWPSLARSGYDGNKAIVDFLIQFSK